MQTPLQFFAPGSQPKYGQLPDSLSDHVQYGVEKNFTIYLIPYLIWRIDLHYCILSRSLRQSRKLCGGMGDAGWATLDGRVIGTRADILGQRFGRTEGLAP
jgi:hypothetical protein